MHAGQEGLFLLEKFSPFLSDPCLIAVLTECVWGCVLQQAAELAGISLLCYCGNCKAVEMLGAPMYPC